DITLNWQTATETNNQGFQIERRKTQNDSNEDWNSIGFVNGNGTTTEPQSYSFADKNLEAGKFQYRLKQIDFDGTFEYSNVIEVEIVPPLKFSLEQNYPNPFNPVTTIKYTIPTPPSSSPLAKGRNEVGFVTLKVYDVLGKEVATLVNEEKPSGHYEINFDASNLASGIYYYQLRAGEFVETKKMTLLK
ncbi:MAG TPA: T9SS type A sorting domain-containing protein, partial [Bacteroidia bacterium]|nr:T9SS type A sorting domain-containing protein [Bacteroidia bacterium]